MVTMDSMSGGGRPHLILGGSHGIGFAYASHFASQRDRLVLVGRNGEDLANSRAILERSGSPEVESVVADLLDPDDRRRIMRRWPPHKVSTVFVGGPSPPVGSLASATIKELDRACEVCLSYPVDILQGYTGARDPRPRIVILSSSAADEPLCDHQFFLSALLRRNLDAIVNCLSAQIDSVVEVWKPHVVFTRLSRRFAEQLTDGRSDEALKAVLADHFGVRSVPTAQEYVDQMLDTR